MVSNRTVEGLLGAFRLAFLEAGGALEALTVVADRAPFSGLFRLAAASGRTALTQLVSQLVRAIQPRPLAGRSGTARGVAAMNRTQRLAFVVFDALVLSALPFATEDHVLFVLSVINHLLPEMSASAMSVLELVYGGLFGDGDGDDGRDVNISAQSPAAAAAAAAAAKGVDRVELEEARAAGLCLLTMLLLKSHLKSAFGLSTDRCMEYDPASRAKTDRPVSLYDFLPEGVSLCVCVCVCVCVLLAWRRAGLCLSDYWSDKSGKLPTSITNVSHG